MKKLCSPRLMFIITSFLCLNLIQAQMPSGLPVTSLPVTTPPPTIPATSTAPTGGGPAAPNPPPSTLTPATPVIITGKYAEYQSFCRQNNVHELEPYSSEQKKRRLDFLEKKYAKNLKNATVINALIKEYLQQKNVNAAEDLFNSTSENLKPEEAAVWAAEFTFQKKHAAAATIQLEKFISEKSTTKTGLKISTTKPLIKLAQIKLSQLFFNEAAEIYLDLQAEEKAGDYSRELCEVYALDSHHKDAEKNCLKAINKYPEDPAPDIYLGISYRERELFTEAQTYFENSLKKRKTEFGLTCLGELHYLKKENTKALEVLRQAVEANKNSYRAKIILALALFDEKKYADALVEFKNACEIDSKNNSEIHKSYLYLEEKKSPLTKSYFEQIQKCNNQKSF
jgi:tetratricopeptide (TPR) repeat protein